MAWRDSSLAAAAVLLAALTGCGSVAAPSPEVHGHTVTVTPALTGRAVDLALDQQLEVRLPVNPVSDFDWMRDGAESGVLAAIGQPGFESGSPGQSEVENGGFEVWRFKPTAAGQQNLRFEYRRRGQLMTATPESVWFLVTVR